MRRDTLQALVERRAGDSDIVRAVDLETGDEQIIKDFSDTSPLGLAAATAMREGTSRRVVIAERAWFLTVYSAPPELVILGAVHIAQSLAALALVAGWRVRVIDPRSAYALPERFPGVRLVTAWPQDAFAVEPLTAASSVVVLAHDPKLDDPALEAALKARVSYIGALGSRRTHAKRLSRLRELGISKDALARIHGPVGLPIGARGPAEIAISILGQIIQNRRRPKIGSIILAAGLSQRMGRNKLLMNLNAKSVVRHVAEAALASRTDPVIVVTGHKALEVRDALAGLDIRFVHNEEFAKGLSTSLRCGLRALRDFDCAGALVLLGDMPLVSPDLIDRIVAAHDPQHGKTICVATVSGQRGHPVLWDLSHFDDIENLSGDVGAREIMNANAAAVLEVDTDSKGAVVDIDTEEDFEKVI